MAAITLMPKTAYRFTRFADRFELGSRAELRPVTGPRLEFPRAIPVAGLNRDICVKIASTPSEWEEAFQLVADKYQARGYEGPDAADFRFTSYHALPDSVVLVAKAEDRVIATFSMVADNTLLGLPMESLYRTEIQNLRREGRQIFETGSLADRNLNPGEFLPVFLALKQLGCQYGVGQGGDTMVITINPRHRAFYTKMLGFATLGPWRAYPKVQGHPAEAYYIDPKLMQAKAPRAHQQIFGRRLPLEALAAPRMPANLVRHFGSHSSQTDRRFINEILRYVDDCGSPRRW